MPTRIENNNQKSMSKMSRLLLAFILLYLASWMLTTSIHANQMIPQEKRKVPSHREFHARLKETQNYSKILAQRNRLHPQLMGQGRKRITEVDNRPILHGTNVNSSSLHVMNELTATDRTLRGRVALNAEDTERKRKISRNTTNNNDAPFVAYQLHPHQPYNITFGYFTRCTVGITTNKWGRKPVNRVPLSQELKQLLDFSTTIQTNRKILSLGDSVAIQFHQLLEEAAGATWDHRTIYQYAWGEHESTSVVAPIDGGGVLAAFRITGMLIEKGRGIKPDNGGGRGGWLPDHIQQLLNHSYTSSSGKRVEVGGFNDMIFRIPHGWLTLEQITKDSLIETLQTAHSVFGVTTAIVLTLPLNNNVKTEQELIQLKETNTMIRNVVEEWEPSGGIETVMLLEFGAWADSLMHLNAKLAGMDQTPSNYTLQRLGCTKYPPSIAMICTNVVTPGSCACDRNMLSIDGMHWCMESVGGRLLAGIACLLQCPLEHAHDRTATKDCANNCNTKFMNLEPIATEL